MKEKRDGKNRDFPSSEPGMRRCRTFIGICREAYSFRQDTKDGARSPRQRDRQWGQKAEDPWSGKTYQGRGGEREATSFEIKQQGDGRWRSECLAAKDNVRSPGKDSSNQRITCRSLAAYSQRLPSGAYSRKKIQRLLHKITGKIICCNKRQQNGTFHPSSFTGRKSLPLLRPAVTMLPSLFSSTLSLP